jgi:CheY-like chemotaxis protein
MEREEEHPSRRSVLYVEDHPVNVMLMSALFDRRPELRLEVATTGQEAVCCASGLNPALLLVDLRLPDCHGSQLLDVLRLIPGCEDTPAVAVTADGAYDIRGTGFSELWAKPMDLQHVLRRLDALTALTRGDVPAAAAGRAAAAAA